MYRKTATSPRKMDRRVRRTRDALGDALVKLMHQKAFKAIKVQDLLDHAHVSRATFYTHYKDKDDLFLSDVEDFFELMANLLSRRGETSHRVAPVRELFAHVAEWREFHAALVAAGKVHDVLELGQEHFARAIEHRLSELRPADPITHTLRRAVAQGLAGAQLSLLSWWINGGMPTSPEHMDELYHHMVWSGIGAQPSQTPSTASR